MHQTGWRERELERSRHKKKERGEGEEECYARNGWAVLRLKAAIRNQLAKV